jgi:hypothetical protein
MVQLCSGHPVKTRAIMETAHSEKVLSQGLFTQLFLTVYVEVGGDITFREI